MVREKKLILVIDDQKDTRDLIQTTLTNDKYSVITAPGGREGIQLAKLRKPDIILLDMVMPRLDGVQTCALLKKIPITKKIPVVFLTATKDKEKVMAAIKAGGVDYVVKPFNPAEMIQRVEKFTGGEEETFEAGSIVAEEEIPEEFIAQKEEAEKEKERESPFTLERNGKIICMTINLPELDLESYRIFRDAFNDIINDSIIRVIVDLKRVQKIDGAGLCLLITVSNTLKSLGGKLCIVSPPREATRKISYVSLNYLLPSFQSADEAQLNVNLPLKEEDETAKLKGLQVCIACSYVNQPKTKFCSNCGARMDLGGDDRILKTLAQVMSRKVLHDADTDDMAEINKVREINPEEKQTPREFNVEIKADKATIIYHARLVSDAQLEAKEQISIRAPEVEGHFIAPKIGTPVVLENSEVGRRSRFNSEVKGLDAEKKSLAVHYTEEAKMLHSESSFSIKIKDSITPIFLDPKVSGDGGLFKASIVELSRLGMHVYSIDDIPVDCCLAARFDLPDETRISSALVVAHPTEDDFLYNVEFAVITEKEKSKVIQYMYQCQIEQNK